MADGPPLAQFTQRRRVPTPCLQCGKRKVKCIVRGVGMDCRRCSEKHLPCDYAVARSAVIPASSYSHSNPPTHTYDPYPSYSQASGSSLPSTALANYALLSTQGWGLPQPSLPDLNSNDSSPPSISAPQLPTSTFDLYTQDFPLHGISSSSQLWSQEATGLLSSATFLRTRGQKSQSEAFLIYTPHERNTPKTAEYSSTPNGRRSLDSGSIGDCTTALCDPKDAAAWLESNWHTPCCISIRTQITNLLPCMLSAEESALVIFGVVENTEIAYVAQSLANASGFSVIVRPTDHDPAPTLLPPDPPDFNTNNNHRDGHHQSSNDNRSHSWDGEAGFSTSGQNPGENEDDEGNYDHAVPQIRYSVADDPLRFGGGAGGGDGGDGGQPPTTDDHWESPLHRTRVKLDLQVDDARRYTVVLGCSFKFKINRDTDIPIDLADLTRPLSQPEVISLFDITIETRPRETQVDRSYANFGFIAHRAASIVERTFLHRGFEQPDKIYKHGKQQETQQGVKASFGFSQGSPLLTSSFSYNWNNNLTMEATDNKAGRVDYEPGDEWDNGGKSFSSYNIAYQPQEVPFRQNSEPIQVRVGMGINLFPPGSEMSLPRISFIDRKQVLIWVSDPTSKAKIRGILVLLTNYLDNIRIPKALCISEQQLVKLAKSSYQFQPQDDQRKSGTISLSVAKVQKPIVPSTSRLRDMVPKFNRRRSETVSSDIPPHEYLARGWDVNNEEWRNVLWPALDKDFRAADVEGTLPVWNLQCPWRSVQGWNASSSSPLKD